jgi:uncharacterized membrane protein YgcG
MEMKKKLLVFAFVMAVLLPRLPLNAQIVDLADLLGDAEETRLTMMIDEIKAAYDFNIFIYTVKSLEGHAPKDVSQEIVDMIEATQEIIGSMGLGEGTWNGCLLLQSTGDREYDFTAAGRGGKILNTAAFDKLEKDVVSYLRRDDYTGAYEAFIRDWEYFLVLESQGKSYNFLRDDLTHGICLLAAWVIALVIGLIAVHSMKAKMNTALPKTQADAYIIPGSLALTKQNDKFLYSTTTKTARKSASSSGGRGGSGGGGRISRGGKY